MELIKVSESGGKQTVNARDLHEFLGAGKMFSHWIKDRIESYGFVENQDFWVFAETGKNPLGGRPAIEYALSIDMAKELAMVERNEKGRIARQYFILFARETSAFRPGRDSAACEASPSSRSP